ncbi:MAG: ATP-binding cassette domain-containing protein [Actinomycetaceae bacterium]|nr:ATP-binding cassette domain-containing protein [Actinomycetaceae bacterium]
MDQGKNVVELANVEVRRQGRPIVKDLDWTVRPGENWVILGPNGAGKTTLVQMLTGRVFPSYRQDTPATAKVLNYRLGRVDLSELRTVVGIASAAERALLPGDQPVIDALMSVLYGRSVRGREEYEDTDLQRAHDLLHIFGIAHLAPRQLRTLSEGETQRVHIARALMTDPQILILDEPTAGLDLGARELLMLALEEIAADKRAPALILVTHHVEEIPRGFTHAALMNEGAIVSSGPIEDVLVDDVVSSTFGLPLKVSLVEGRWSARAIGEADISTQL